MAFTQEYMGWSSGVHYQAEMGVKQEVLEALCTSEWPLWGKAFATNKAETLADSPSPSF